MKESRRSDQIATLIFRAMVGCVGLLIVALVLISKPDWKSIVGCLSLSGLLLGYAFGGDQWGARLFNLFSISKISEEDDSDEGVR